MNYNTVLKHANSGCAPEQIDLGVTETLEQCAAKYTEATKSGKCLLATNAFEFVANEHCDCCAPEYTLQMAEMEAYNIYQVD